jgi:hypothetical protein
MSLVKHASPRRSTKLLTEWLACNFFEVSSPLWCQRVKKLLYLIHLKPRMLLVDDEDRQASCSFQNRWRRHDSAEMSEITKKDLFHFLDYSMIIRMLVYLYLYLYF